MESKANIKIEYDSGRGNGQNMGGTENYGYDKSIYGSGGKHDL